MKIKQIIEWGIIGFAVLFGLLLICPVQDGLKGFEVFFSDYRLAIAYLSSIIACLLIIIRKKVKNIEIISLIY